MLNLNKKTAVILLSDGLPDKIDAIHPFLFNFFNDVNITNIVQPLRFFLAKLKAYQKTASITALLTQIESRKTLSDSLLAQANALERELSYYGDFKVIVSTKYAVPSMKDACREIDKYDPDQVILLPLYPQFSAINAGSSIESFYTKMGCDRGVDAKKRLVKFTNCYPQVNGFITSHSLLIQKTIQKHLSDIENLTFLFVAPGIPKRLINQGDPYLSQIEMTVKAVMENLETALKLAQGQLDYHICFQPKMALIEFMKPTLEQKMKRAILQEKKPVIIPIASNFDSIETKLDLDIKYRDVARKFGLTDYLLVPNPNYDGHFIKALVEICQEIDASDRFLLSVDTA